MRPQIVAAEDVAGGAAERAANDDDGGGYLGSGGDLVEMLDGLGGCIVRWAIVEDCHFRRHRYLSDDYGDLEMGARVESPTD